MSGDLQLWKAFLAASQTLSFTRAAERLGISQPRLSLLIRQLEDRLGLRLFERSHRRVELTSEGERLHEKAEALVGAYRGLDDTVWELRQMGRTRLRLGSPRYTLEIPERLDFMGDFHEQRPSVKLEIDSNGNSPPLLERLRAGELDLVFATEPFDETGLITVPFAACRTLVVIPAEDPAASMVQIPLAMVAGKTMATYPVDVGAAYYEAWFGPLEKAGATLVQAHDDHPASLLKFAARHRYWTVAHEWAGHEVRVDPEDRMVLRRLVAGEAARISILLTRRAGPLPPAAQALWDMAVARHDRRASA
ncbi:MAG: transcriptional regulator, LysR family [Caulobacter sp.]|nr:transcriptional regulator, LysR family [Caulobacter sp.]